MFQDKQRHAIASGCGRFPIFSSAKRGDCNKTQRNAGRPKNEYQGTKNETRAKNKKRLTRESETQSVETSKNPTEMYQPQKATDRMKGQGGQNVHR